MQVPRTNYVKTRGSQFLKNVFIISVIGVILILWFLFDEKSSRYYGLMVAIFPVAIYFALSNFDDVGSLFSIGSFLMVYYLLFFVVRGIQLSFFKNTKMTISILTDYSLQETLIGIGITMVFFVAGYFLSSQWKFPKIPVLEKIISREISTRRLLILSLMVLALSSLGFMLLYVEYGGLKGLFNRFASHQKVFELSMLESFGVMFWVTFNSWTVWLWTLLYSTVKRNKFWIGITLISIIVLFVSISIFIFGSRTYLISLLFGTLVIYHWRIRHIPKALIFILLPLGIVFSFWIVGYRTNSVGLLSIETVLENLGHSVLDVMIAIVRDPLPKSFVTNPDRWWQIPVSLIPRIIWPGKPQITYNRLDWLVSFYYNGRGRTINVGTPPSMFGEWFLYGGWPLVTIVSFVIGSASGVIDRWLISNRGRISAFIIYIPLSYSIITYFKDGDIVMNFISTVKIMIIAIVFIFLVSKNSFPRKSSLHKKLLN